MMKRYLITSELYNGSVEVLYMDGLLQRIDFSETNCGPHQRMHIKAKVPADFAQFKEAFANTKAVIIEADYKISFEAFWNMYGKKVHPSRCRPLWDKLSDADKVKAYIGIKKYNNWLRTQGDRCKLDPENYLKRKTWENEY